MDVWEYFAQREAEARALSLGWNGDFWDMVGAEAGDKRGRLFGQFILSPRAFLAVNEIVVVVGNHVHREEYGYFLIIDGAEAWGEERDLSHHPAVHRHTSAAHVREDGTPISFRAAVEAAWREVSQLTDGEDE
jgi:hypothetical protein